MELIFVRHGETEFNKHHQLMGQRIDAPLDEKGLEQAKEVIGKLPDDFEIIYSSPLKRAAQTAEIIANHFSKAVEYNNNLKERDFGSLSGKTWHQIDEEVGAHLSELDEQLKYDYTPYGGETAEQVRSRLNTFIEEVRSKHPDSKIVVVTHYGLINLMNQMFPHKEHHKLTNTSIHKFEI
ncbi:MAG TPA: histidine phosphatase family protein [Candidatus Binatia bacterium]|nr:histidine phosphatase family protein [Candidatus Binatia bacterium]